MGSLSIERVLSYLDEETFTPEGLRKLNYDILRELKINPVRADNFITYISRVTAKEQMDFEVSDTEALINKLISIEGIGPWSIQTFKIFALNDKNIAWVNEKKVRLGLMLYFELEKEPTISSSKKLFESINENKTDFSLKMYFLYFDSINQKINKNPFT